MFQLDWKATFNFRVILRFVLLRLYGQLNAVAAQSHWCCWRQASSGAIANCHSRERSMNIIDFAFVSKKHEFVVKASKRLRCNIAIEDDFCGQSSASIMMIDGVEHGRLSVTGAFDKIRHFLHIAGENSVYVSESVATAMNFLDLL